MCGSEFFKRIFSLIVRAVGQDVFVQKTNIIPGNLRTSDDDVGPRTGPRLRELPTSTPTHQTTHSHR